MSETTERIWRLLERGFRSRIGLVIAAFVIVFWLFMLVVQYKYGAP